MRDYIQEINDTLKDWIGSVNGNSDQETLKEFLGEFSGMGIHMLKFCMALISDEAGREHFKALVNEQLAQRNEVIQ